MSNEILKAIRCTLTGILVGAGTASLVDYAALSLIGTIEKEFPASGPTSSPGMTGRKALEWIVNLSIASTGILLGDKLLTQLLGGLEDPLFRLGYYNTAIFTSSATSSAMNNARNAFGRLLSVSTPVATTKPPPGNSIQGGGAPPSSTGSMSYASSSCLGCQVRGRKCGNC